MIMITTVTLIKSGAPFFSTALPTNAEVTANPAEPSPLDRP